MRFSLRSKILCSFLLASVVITVTVSGFMYANFRDILYQRASNDISDLLINEKNNLDSVIRKIKNCGEYIGLNEYMMAAAMQENEDPIQQNIAITAFKREFQTMYELLMDSGISEYALNFYLNPSLPISSHLLDSSFVDNNSSFGIYTFGNGDEVEWYQKAMAANGDLYIFCNATKNYIYFARRIDFLTLKGDDQFFGVSVIGLDFGKKLREIEKRAAFTNTSFAVIGLDGNIVSKSSHAPSDSFILQHYLENPANSYSSEAIQIDDCLMHIAKTDAGLGLVSFTPISDVADRAVKGKSIFIAAISTGLPLLILISIFLSFVLCRPLQSLAKQLEETRGENLSPLYRPRRSRDEVDDLYQAINGLIDRVNRLVKENTKRAQREKELEFLMYQMRINPHFLYNTLDSIFWKALTCGEQEIANMASNLSKIFEYSIRGDDLKATLSDEIEMLQTYVNLQCERFGNQIQFTASLDGCADITIPKCLLQPLVENSIIHGMEEGRVLTIYLRAEITSKGFILYIEDNGKGHCADQLNSYLCGAGAEEIDKQKMGVSNVNKRIAFVYGSGSELRYVNNDKGMTAIINIELDKKGGYEQ